MNRKYLIAAQALKEHQTARSLARMMIVRERKAQAEFRAILGQIRIQNVEVDYPVSVVYTRDQKPLPTLKEISRSVDKSSLSA